MEQRHDVTSLRLLLIAVGTSMALIVGMLFASAAVWGQGSGPTRADYVNTIEPMCQAGTKAMQKAQSGSATDFKHGRHRRAGAKLIKSSSIMRRYLTEIAAVPRPPADAATLTTWFDRLNVFAGDIARIGRIIKTDHLAKLGNAQKRYARDGREANNIVAGFGFSACRTN
jgi:hypothetical protein